MSNEPRALRPAANDRGHPDEQRTARAAPRRERTEVTPMSNEPRALRPAANEQRSPR